MWDEIKGYVTLFVVIPFALGCLYYGVHWLATGDFPNPQRADCYIEWDGVSNPTVCD